MKRKTTDELFKNLSQEKNLQNYLNANSAEFEHSSLQEELNRLLTEHGQKKADVIRLSNLDPVYAYQIFDGSKSNPARSKLLALCISIGASLKETQKILRLGHWEPLYPRSIRDSIIIYAIEHQTPVMDVNSILYDMHMELLR